MFIKHQELFMGRIGKVEELKEVGSTHLIKFSIAEDIKKQDENTKEWNTVSTTWTNCTLWGQEALAFAKCPVCRQGQFIIVSGVRESNTYTNQEGQTKTVQQLRVESVSIPVQKWSFPSALQSINKEGVVVNVDLNKQKSPKQETTKQQQTQPSTQTATNIGQTPVKIPGDDLDLSLGEDFDLALDFNDDDLPF